MPKGDKYIALTNYLKDTNREIIKLSFKEIEQIIGEKLSKSAYNYHEFWSNTTSHSIAFGWFNAGYKKKFVDIKVKDVNTSKKGLLKSALYFVLIGGIVFIFIRSSFDIKPISTINAFVSGNNALANLTLNGLFTSLRYMTENEAVSKDIYSFYDDIVLDSRITITDKTLTIDLNGKTISGSESMKSSSGMILVDNEGNLIIDDTSEEKTGTIDGSSSLDGEYYRIYSALTVWPDDGHKASLTIRNGNIIGDYYAIAGQGTVTAQDSTSIVVENGYLKSNDGAAIYHPQNGSLTIHDGILVGDDTAIEIRAGNLTINGGDFTAIRTPTETKPNGSGTTTVGSAIAVVQHTTKLSISVNISGGVFNAYTPIFESNTQNNPDIKDQIELKISGGSFLVTQNGVESINCEDCEGFITGGEFSLEPAAKYIATGYSAVHSGSSWIVQAN